MSNPIESIEFGSKREFVASLKKLGFILNYDQTGDRPINYYQPFDLEPTDKLALEKWMLTISKEDWGK